MASSRIQVANGNTIDPLNPDPADIHIEDIAHALSNQCRFSGHVKKFYSVAEHSIKVSHAVPKEDALWGLLHDASEAYLVDVPSPIKNDLFGKQYREVEDMLMSVICEKYGLDPEMPASVKAADNSLLRTEVRDLLHPMKTQEAFDNLWAPWFYEEPQSYKITHPYTPATAKWIFLSNFHILTKGVFSGELEAV